MPVDRQPSKLVDDRYDARTGAAAGPLRARYYHRSRCPVSMADRIAAQIAFDRVGFLATSDPPLLGLCHAEGIATITLPGSDGSRWTPAT